MNYLDTLITSRHIKSKRDGEEETKTKPTIRDRYHRKLSLSVNRKQPKQTLIKINKKRFPKDFFTIQTAPVTPRLAAREKDLKQSRQSNEQTIDTPSPSSYPTASEEQMYFNRTSFFGQEDLVPKTTSIREELGYRSNQKRPSSRSRVKGKLTAIPVLNKIEPFALNDQLYNCTFSKGFSFKNSPFSQSIQVNILPEAKYPKPILRNIFNAEAFYDGYKKDASPQRIDFCLRKKILLSNRASSQLPRINP